MVIVAVLVARARAVAGAAACSYSAGAAAAATVVVDGMDSVALAVPRSEVAAFTAPPADLYNQTHHKLARHHKSFVFLMCLFRDEVNLFTSV